MLAYGVPVDARNVSGSTALYCAVSAGQLGAAEVLVRAGAQVEAVDGYGRLPLYLAARAGRVELCSFLVSKGAGAGVEPYVQALCPLFMAASLGYGSVVQQLLESGLGSKQEAVLAAAKSAASGKGLAVWHTITCHVHQVMPEALTDCVRCIGKAELVKLLVADRKREVSSLRQQLEDIQDSWEGVQQLFLLVGVRRKQAASRVRALQGMGGQVPAAAKGEAGGAAGGTQGAALGGAEAGALGGIPDETAGDAAAGAASDTAAGAAGGTRGASLGGAAGGAAGDAAEGQADFGCYRVPPGVV